MDVLAWMLVVAEPGVVVTIAHNKATRTFVASVDSPFTWTLRGPRRASDWPNFNAVLSRGLQSLGTRGEGGNGLSVGWSEHVTFIGHIHRLVCKRFMAPQKNTVVAVTTGHRSG